MYINAIPGAGAVQPAAVMDVGGARAAQPAAVMDVGDAGPAQPAAAQREKRQGDALTPASPKRPRASTDVGVASIPPPFPALNYVAQLPWDALMAFAGNFLRHDNPTLVSAWIQRADALIRPLPHMAHWDHPATLARILRTHLVLEDVLASAASPLLREYYYLGLFTLDNSDLLFKQMQDLPCAMILDPATFKWVSGYYRDRSIAVWSGYTKRIEAELQRLSADDLRAQLAQYEQGAVLDNSFLLKSQIPEVVLHWFNCRHQQLFTHPAMLPAYGLLKRLIGFCTQFGSNFLAQYHLTPEMLQCLNDSARQSSDKLNEMLNCFVDKSLWLSLILTQGSDEVFKQWLLTLPKDKTALKAKLDIIPDASFLNAAQRCIQTPRLREHWLACYARSQNFDLSTIDAATIFQTETIAKTFLKAGGLLRNRFFEAAGVPPSAESVTAFKNCFASRAKPDTAALATANAALLQAFHDAPDGFVYGGFNDWLKTTPEGHARMALILERSPQLFVCGEECSSRIEAAHRSRHTDYKTIAYPDRLQRLQHYSFQDKLAAMIRHLPAGTPFQGMLHIHRKRVAFETFSNKRFNVPQYWQYTGSFPQESGVAFADETSRGDGVTREWLQLLCTDLADPRRMLMAICGRTGSLVRPNHDTLAMALPGTSTAQIASHARNAMVMFGRALGQCIKRNIVPNIRFPSFFLKLISGEPLSAADLQEAEPEVLAQVMSCLRCSSEELEAYDLRFSMDTGMADITANFDFKIDGRPRPVTVASRAAYIHHCIRERITISPLIGREIINPLVPASETRVMAATTPEELVVLAQEVLPRNAAGHRLVLTLANRESVLSELRRVAWGRPLEYYNLKVVDPTLYEQLHAVQEASPEALAAMNIPWTYSVTHDLTSTRRTIELKPGGAAIPVTMENRCEFVALWIQQKLRTLAMPDNEVMTSILSGLWDVIPPNRLAMFSTQELRQLLCAPEGPLNIDDWQSHTTPLPADATPAQKASAAWFWQIVHELTQDQQRRLFQLVTTRTSPPPGGFVNLHPQFHTLLDPWIPLDRLPEIHTCFNQIVLPLYESKERLRDRLMYLIDNLGDAYLQP